MKSALLLVTSLTALLLLPGCGEESPEVEAREETTIDTLTLTVTDTIGVLVGDSTQEFATLLKVRFDRQGNIFAMDGQKATLSVFSPECERLRTIGHLGSGPGEFQFPSGFAFLRQGGLVVSDYGGHALCFFDSSFEYDSCIAGFSPVAPVEPVTGPGGSFVAGCLDLRVTDEGYAGTSDLGRYTGEGMDPEYIYRSYPLIIEFTESNGEVRVNVQNVDCVWEADSAGSVFFAVRVDSTYCVELFEPDGSAGVVVEKDWERIAKTPEEMAEGSLNEGMSRTDDGTTSIRREVVEDVDPYHLAIGTLNVDSEGNVWVGQGYTSTPTFEVYDREGNLLRIVTIPDLKGVRGLRYCFMGGMLAYDYAPLDYPKIYLLEHAN